MLTLDDLIAKIEDTEDFKVSMQIFLSSKEQLIASLVEKKDKEALMQLLESDLKNLADLKEKLTASGEHIANLNKIERYIS